MQEGNISLGMLKNVPFGREIFTLSPAAYITVDSKKLVSDLFHAGSSLVGSESIKRRKRSSEWPPNIAISSKPFHMQHRGMLPCISLTLHCKYPAKSCF